ncbi:MULTISPECIES: alpha/beta fold hydrolase [unclassified Undibacterium]|uniref:alpha/beta fold hydrolase n=1 Tax=unclassified Undibacterium TaxID=2630295 RepID=UPI002AC9BA34|nr:MULTISPECIES: alpha/beta fold hydrolase [unclassified Undibacterium]MEB0139135.1 alpha/beta fold hydrolase [Undibacterium sp. CCC2.1]MEB0172885.1 alpha/beta fold hydrolase [Undibacterium sp. CCC1.1]MEB0176643.1 alpha/beta fold hydrolase [Undibacterium sp. CCC3.4]MEB0216029.1 alpha/beta fold hydrolase [Undibacterium sp. 5I2]WPX43130.1 alpha/beta fold hydrolase [Undibacterium sp. CCC3.4]
MFTMFAMLKNSWENLVARVFRHAIAARCRRAGLRQQTMPMPYGSVAYLDNAAAGTAIVLLHDAGADKNSWLACAARFGRGQRLLILDLPGHGDSGADLELEYDVHSQTERVLEFIEQLSLSQVHLIGNGLGSAIALRLAHWRPQLCVSLILINVGGLPGPASVLTTVLGTSGKDPLMDIGSLDDFKLLLELSMYRVPYLPRPLLHLLARQKIARHAIDLKIAADLRRDLDQSAVLAQLHLPTLIIWGADDKISHVDGAALLHARISGSALLIVPECGHLPMLEQAAVVAARCTRFLAAFNAA